MSYILDALRRADAERSRGVVPGLHAHGLPGDTEAAARRPVLPGWAVGAVAVLVLAGGVVAWLAPWRGAPDSRVAQVSAPVPGVREDAPAPAPAAQGALPPGPPGALDPAARPIEPPLAHAVQPAPADAGAPPPYPPPRGVARDPQAERVAAGRVATLEPRAPARAPAAAAPVSAVEHYGAPIAAAPAPARSTAVVALNDLPPDVRAQLPRLAVGGAIYSETPSARMVILNGQVFHEGDKPAADTVLEQIRLKSAVLNFRGQRYEVAF